MKMAEKLWDGRFSEKTHHSVETFTASVDVDRRLYAHDIAGSAAHCRVLARAGVITDEEASQMVQGLGEIQRDIERGRFEYSESLEDIHMHIESRLVEKIGKVAQKLHTARSRNDQVALDIRLYLRAETKAIIDALGQWRRVIVAFSRSHLGTILPGYTHLQRAQPVLFSHHLMAYYEMFTRDTERFSDCLERINVMPLGSAALAGTTYPIDRAYAAELLDFPRVSANSMDAVADRDFIIEFLAAASLCMIHFSRISEELILWSSSEFGFIELSDAFSTGSSIMPQKKNPDVPELVRGKTGRVVGDLVALLTLMKSLPMAYNRDMQEDKGPLFDAVDTVRAVIDIYAQMLPRITVKADAMGEAAEKGFLNATDMADYLVSKGMPFRKAHSVVGRAVAHALDRGKELHQLPLQDLQTFSSLFDNDIFHALETGQVVNRRVSAGGTALENVAAAIEAAEKVVTP
jgi:argininosuccinate lyase